jgi:hypothetical protein
LFGVVALAVILAASLFSPVAAISGITIAKVTTNGDVTTEFPFVVSGDASTGFNLVGGGSQLITETAEVVLTVTEEVPHGWVLTDVTCVGLPIVPESSSFTYIRGGVIVTYVVGDHVTCAFTNSPAPAAPVGGVVMPAGTLAILGPWLAFIGVVGCIGTAVVIAKKRHP